MRLLTILVLPVALGVLLYFGWQVVFPPKPVVVEENGWYGTGSPRKDDEKIVPFEVKVPDEVLDDLKKRLASARISHEPLEDSDNFQYGFNSKYLKKVVDYWLNKYDWRKQEAIINRYKQFKTQIEGLQVHYYHVKPSSQYKKVYPLLVVHGWPGNVYEFYKLIPMLTDPKAHKINSEYAFEVIAPSIPGYGWSEQPKKTGFSQIATARVFKKLMLRLGHDKFFAQGGDWGSVVVKNLAHIYPQHVRGVHVNMIVVFPLTNAKSTFLSLLGTLMPKAVFAHETYHDYNVFSHFLNLIIESGYMHLQATKPDTIGTALNDSPLGLAAYILEKFSTWTNLGYRDLPDGGLTKKFTMDELLTIVTIYWVNGNIASSQRYYKEFFLDRRNDALSKQYMPVPLAHAHFKNEMFDRDPPEIVATTVNLTQHTVLPDGGHFAAFEEPKYLASNVFTFVDSLTK